jgi:hypothetical protein
MQCGGRKFVEVRDGDRVIVPSKRRLLSRNRAGKLEHVYRGRKYAVVTDVIGGYYINIRGGQSK